VSDVSSLERIHRFERRMQEDIASRYERFDWGTAYFNQDFPLVWDLNFLELDGGEAHSMSADDLVALAEEIQAPTGVGHRRIMLDDVTLAERLAPRFRELEWMVNKFVFMELRRAPSASGSTRRAHEIDHDTHRATYVRTATEAPYGSQPEVVRQLADQTALIAAKSSVRYFGATDDDGTVASICVLYSDGEVAQIEDVATLDAYRRRGLAAELLALTIRAAQDAGHDLIFLVADAEDWPKDLYAKLGFEPIGYSYDFVRPGDVVYKND
jgi:N-acetylglutamate synthase-like GNAT family acetyltransferase